MKKLLYVFAAVLPMVLMANLSEAQAQKNNAAKEMKPSAEMSMKCDKKIKHWIAEENEEIMEDYNKAMKKIEKSTFSDGNKSLLKKQAMENKDLMMKQVKEKADLKAKHWKEREGLKEEMKKDKENHKAVKEVKEIID